MGVKDFLSGGQPIYRQRYVHDLSHTLRKIPDGHRLISPHVECRISRSINHGGDRDAACYGGDVGEATGLAAIAKDRHRLAFERAAHENADDIAIRVGNVLAWSEYIMRSKDRVCRSAEIVVKRLDVMLAG